MVWSNRVPVGTAASIGGILACALQARLQRADEQTGRTSPGCGSDSDARQRADAHAVPDRNPTAHANSPADAHKHPNTKGRADVDSDPPIGSNGAA